MNSAAVAWIGVAVLVNAWWIFWASWAFVFVLALMHFAMAHYRR